MNTDPHPRDVALRGLLVASVDATPLTARRARMSWRPLVAFVVAGALTGGAVGIAASATERTSNVTMASATISTPSWVRDDMTLIGDEIVVYNPDAPISVGTRPEGATHLAMQITCLAPEARHTEQIDGEPAGGGTCSKADPDVPRTSFGGGGMPHVVTGDGPHEVTVSASGLIAVWLSWVAIPAPPEPSAAQRDELADGVVTLDEYQAAKLRYRACLQASGFDVTLIDRNDPYRWVLSDEVVSSGVDESCYQAELAQVDMMWQAAHPQE